MNARDMQGRNSRFLLIVLVLVFGLFPSGVAASTYDSILAFGDSLSQTTGGPYDGRWIVGQVWVEYLADKLNVGKTSVAATFAMTSDLSTQVSGVSGEISNSTLVTIWSGSADIIDLLNTHGYTELEHNYSNSYIEAVNNIDSTIEALYDKGARNFFIPYLLDIGIVPDVINDNGTDEAGFASMWSNGFNQELVARLAILEGYKKYSDCNFYTYDTYALLHDIKNNTSKYNAYGIYSFDDAFWTDELHPSSKTHALFADEFGGVVTPLPASLLLFGSGLLGLIGVRRRIKG